jgi:hypothetical protein
MDGPDGQADGRADGRARWIDHDLDKPWLLWLNVNRYLYKEIDFLSSISVILTGTSRDRVHHETRLARLVANPARSKRTPTRYILNEQYTSKMYMAHFKFLT